MRALRIIVERCVFEGGMCAVAFAGSQDCTVRFNTIHRPGNYRVVVSNGSGSVTSADIPVSA